MHKLTYPQIPADLERRSAGDRKTLADAQDPVILYTRTRQGNTLSDRICPACGDPTWRHANAPQDCMATFDALDGDRPAITETIEREREARRRG